MSESFIVWCEAGVCVCVCVCNVDAYLWVVFNVEYVGVASSVCVCLCVWGGHVCVRACVGAYVCVRDRVYVYVPVFACLCIMLVCLFVCLSVCLSMRVGIFVNAYLSVMLLSRGVSSHLLTRLDVCPSLP